MAEHILTPSLLTKVGKLIDDVEGLKSLTQEVLRMLVDRKQGDQVTNSPLVQAVQTQMKEEDIVS